MTKRLEAQIAELYQLPLSEFTSARNALAKTRPGADKKVIASLVKPSLPMWVINQIHWREPSTYNALIDASEKVRAAHRSILSGRKADTKNPDQLHRATVDKAFAKAIVIAEKSGVALTDAVRETIRRTLTALPGEEPAGRLTRPPEPAGFSLLTGVKVRPVAERPESKIQGRTKAESRPVIETAKPSRAEIQAQRRAERQRQAAEKKAQKEKEKREREIQKAEQALKDAERRLAELKR